MKEEGTLVRSFGEVRGSSLALGRVFVMVAIALLGLLLGGGLGSEWASGLTESHNGGSGKNGPNYREKCDTAQVLARLVCARICYISLFII